MPLGRPEKTATSDRNAANPSPPSIGNRNDTTFKTVGCSMSADRLPRTPTSRMTLGANQAQFYS